MKAFGDQPYSKIKEMLSVARCDSVALKLCTLNSIEA
jgi:hypothetical protein